MFRREVERYVNLSSTLTVGIVVSDLTLHPEIFKLHIGNLQCKHIIFGASADNGYARLLGPYSGNEAVTKRITLLEGPPFAGEMATLVGRYPTASFPIVFRDTKIPPRRVSFSSTPPKSASPRPPSWAATLASRPAELDVQPARKAPSTPQVVSRDIPRNSKGQRVDSLIVVSPTLVTMMKQKKLCNSYYLAGGCPYLKCVHPHNEKLNEKQLAALRIVARLAPCKQGLSCDDEVCFSGHQCPREYCNRLDCWFPPEMHDVDTKVVGQ